jgi:hypothetical protein
MRTVCALGTLKLTWIKAEEELLAKIYFWNKSR